MEKLDKLLVMWMRWRKRINQLEVSRLTGNKSSTIEYRLMRELGGLMVDKGSPWEYEDLVEAVDEVWRRLKINYPMEMEALELYYLTNKNMKKIRELYGLSSWKAKALISKSQAIIAGGLAVFTGV